MVTAGQMVALRTSLATLALLRARQLLEAQWNSPWGAPLHLPLVLVLDLSDKQDYSVVKVICNDPVDVAVLFQSNTDNRYGRKEIESVTASLEAELANLTRQYQNKEAVKIINSGS